MEAIERNMAKLPFDVCARGIYLADKTRGNVVGSNVGSLRLVWKPLSENFLADLGPDNSFGHNVFNYPWQDYENMYKDFLTRRFIDAYRRRSAFYPPWIGPISRMSSESLATLWHFPSATVQSPGINRIPATKAAPPPNLPM